MGNVGVDRLAAFELRYSSSLDQYALSCATNSPIHSCVVPSSPAIPPFARQKILRLLRQKFIPVPPLVQLSQCLDSMIVVECQVVPRMPSDRLVCSRLFYCRWTMAPVGAGYWPCCACCCCRYAWYCMACSCGVRPYPPGMPELRGGMVAAEACCSSGESTVDSPASTPLPSAGSGAFRHAW